MGEFLLELWSFMKERKKFWLLPIIILSGSAGEPSSFYFRYCRCTFHLYLILVISQQ